MIAFTFTAPMGGAINFRGLTGSLLAISQVNGGTLTVALDHLSAIPANRLIVQCHAGSIDESRPLRTAYSEAQFFFSPTFKAGNWSISKNGVVDEDGEKVATPSGAGSAGIGFELRGADNADASPIWVNWMATSTGKAAIEVRADGKTIKKITVVVTARNASEIESAKATTDVVLATHVITRTKAIVVGDIVTIPLTLEEITGVKELCLRLS